MMGSRLEGSPAPTFESNIARMRNAFDNVQRVAGGKESFWVCSSPAG